MKTLLLLLKTSFVNNFGIHKLKKMKKGMLLLYVLLACYVIFALLTTFFGFAKSAADFLSKYNLMSLMLILAFIGATFSTFMFTIYNAKNSMFSANDNDLLLSMPIRASTILASRLIYITVWNLVTSLVIVLPFFVVYAMEVNVSLSFYLFAIIVFLLLPIIPTILACIIGYIIAYITSKTNVKNWAELILSFTFIGAIYYVMAKINDIMTFLVTNVDNFEQILKWCFYPIYLVSEVFKDSNAISLLLYIVLNIGLFVIFTYLLSINFKKIIVKLQENRTKSHFKMKKLTSGSADKLLFIKEVKRFLSSPIYVMNTSTGVIMIFIAALASIFYNKEQILSALNVQGASTNFYMFLVPAILFVSFLSSTTSASISLEGKNFWILKTLPIDPSVIFKAKIRLNLVLIIPFVFIALGIMYFTIGLTAMQLLWLLVLTLIGAFASAQFGLLINLKFPKMDAVNDTVVVKRSLSVMITVLVPMVVIFSLSGLYASFSDMFDFDIVVLIIIIVLGCLSLVERILLKTWGVRRFKEIN